MAFANGVVDRIFSTGGLIDFALGASFTAAMTVPGLNAWVVGTTATLIGAHLFVNWEECSRLSSFRMRSKDVPRVTTSTAGATRGATPV